MFLSEWRYVPAQPHVRSNIRRCSSRMVRSSRAEERVRCVHRVAARMFSCSQQVELRPRPYVAGDQVGCFVGSEGRRTSGTDDRAPPVNQSSQKCCGDREADRLQCSSIWRCFSSSVTPCSSSSMDEDTRLTNRPGQLLRPARQGALKSHGARERTRVRSPDRPPEPRAKSIWILPLASFRSADLTASWTPPCAPQADAGTSPGPSESPWPSLPAGAAPVPVLGTTARTSSSCRTLSSLNAFVISVSPVPGVVLAPTESRPSS